MNCHLKLLFTFLIISFLGSPGMAQRGRSALGGMSVPRKNNFSTFSDPNTNKKYNNDSEKQISAQKKANGSDKKEQALADANVLIPNLDLPAVERFPRLFNQYQRFLFDEKLYIQTDKDLYSASDTIYLKGYLREPRFFSPANSGFIYVELIDEGRQVVSRFKFKGEKGSFAGQIPLASSLVAGKYQLRGYSWWMQNSDPDFFFTKNIKVGNDLGLGVSSHVQYKKLSKGELEATVTFLDRNRKPLPDVRIRVVKFLEHGKSRSESLKTNARGEVMVSFSPEMQKSDSLAFRVTSESPAYSYSKRMLLPTLEEKVDVQFFPESGCLVADDPQVVAFKAIGQDGLSVKVSGTVVNSAGEEVAEVNTSHDGMGRIFILPSANESYTAHLKTEKGQELRFMLPRVEKTVAMKCTYRKGKILCSIMNQSTLKDDSLYVVAISRGEMLYCRPLSSLSNRFFQVKTSDFPAGILNLAVVDAWGRKLCERLVFIQDRSPIKFQWTTDKPQYDAREKVNATFSVVDSTGRAYGGDFSVAVTNSRLVPTSEFASTIKSYFLLSSDIKGNVENPMQYFTSSDPVVTDKLDILMLTQGWRRYDLSQIFQNKRPSQPYFLEMGQSLAGKITNFVGAAKSGAAVYLLAPKQGQLYTTMSDKHGNFVFDGLNFVDSTRFVIKTTNPKISMNLLSVELEKESYPSVGRMMNEREWGNEQIEREYFYASKEKMYTSPDGLRMIDLQEVEVVAKKNEDSFTESMMGFASSTYGSEELKSYESYSIEQFIITLPKVGLLMSNYLTSGGGSMTTDSIGNSSGMDEVSGPIVFLVDDQPLDFEYLRGTQMSSIESLAVITDVTSTAVYSASGKPIVMIKLKSGAQLASGEVHSSIAFAMPLGYTPAKEFYVPKYDVDQERLKSIPDLRTTLYWSPSLIVGSESGKGEFNFYTADKSDDLRVIIEGITENGLPCHFESKIEIKK